MKKLLFISFVSVLLLTTSYALADEVSIPIDKAKEIFNKLEPSAEAVWNLENNEFTTGFAVTALRYSIKNIPLADLRAGYALDHVVYFGPKLDVFGLAKLVLPSKVVDGITVSTPQPVREFITHNAAIGLFGGYDWERDKGSYGVTLGGRVSF